MKMIKFLVLTSSIAIFTIGCQPNKPDLEKAKADGIIIGYDSAKSLLSANDSTIFGLSLEKFTYPDPRSYSHIHTITLLKNSDGITIDGGIIAFVDANSESDANHQHTVKYYMPFINTTGLSEQQLLSVKFDSSSGRTLSVKSRTTVIPDANGAPSGLKVDVAYDLTIK